MAPAILAILTACVSDVYKRQVQKGKIRQLFEDGSEYSHFHYHCQSFPRYLLLSVAVHVCGHLTEDPVSYTHLDEFEYAYQMKEISFEIYKARERAIEKLEDELELAEEALENKYGIDD